MRFKTSLRYRVTLAFALLGMLVSFALASAFYKITINIEEQLIAETLSAELEDYIARYKIDQKTLPPSSTSIRTYIIQAGDKTSPTVLRDLDIGLHHIQFNKRQYYAEVKVSGERNFIVLYDDKQIRDKENQFKLFFGIGVMVMTFFSASLGFWLAKRIISPVGELALRVADLEPENYHMSLTENFTNDEVGDLAKDFDAYLLRLSAFIEREQSFTSDVSHELRTPLAVIKGATDVLLSDPDLNEAQRKRVERIARSVNEMSELVTALLLLAREGQDDVSEPTCVVSEVLKMVLDGHQHLLYHKSVEIKLEILDEIILPVECTLLHVVLANLIRNAIYYTEKGYVFIMMDNKGISIKDTGIGISKEQMQRIFDRHYKGADGGEGIGLSLVKRICQKYGWQIEIESIEGCESSFRLWF